MEASTQLGYRAGLTLGLGILELAGHRLPAPAHRPARRAPAHRLPRRRGRDPCARWLTAVLHCLPARARRATLERTRSARAPCARTPYPAIVARTRQSSTRRPFSEAAYTTVPRYLDLGPAHRGYNPRVVTSPACSAKKGACIRPLHRPPPSVRLPVVAAVLH